MNRSRVTLACSSMILSAATVLHGQFFDTESGFTIEGLNEESLASMQEGYAEFTGGWVLKHNGMVMRADTIRVSYDGQSLKPTEAVASGNIFIQRGSFLWTSDYVRYEVEEATLSAQDFKAGRNPFFLQGPAIQGDFVSKSFVANDMTLTTDDYSQPAQKIRARTLTIDIDDYVEARNATLYIENVPVFWLPWIRKGLGRHPNNFVYTPGYRSRFGPFLETDFNWYVNEKLDGTIHLDWRQKRGFAGGSDLRYDLKAAGSGEIQYYYAHDDEPGVGSFDQPIDPNRQRLKYWHEVELGEYFTGRAMVRWQNDEYIVRDFFEGEYRENIQPNSWVEVQKLWNNYSLDIYAQPQINTFQETVERLPEIRFTGYRQQIGETPLYYQTENSLGYLRRRYANDLSPDYEAFRADTFHQIVLPQTYFGWLNFLPRVGGRGTYYSAAEGPGAVTDDQARAVFNTGAELNFKASRLWKESNSRFWDLDGLKHIVQPSINYVYVPRPSVRPPELPQFDYEAFSLRILPNEFPQYNSIDSIDSRNVLRLSLLNKLQTRRGDTPQNFFQWNLFTDLRLDPDSGQGRFSDVYSQFDLLPREWVILTSELQIDTEDLDFREANHSLTIMPSSFWSWSIGHRYLRQNPSLGPDSGNNTFFNRIFFRLNENWGLRMQHRFEGRDGVLEEQIYSIYRDLRSWTAALALRLRDDRVGEDDLTVAFTLSLKSFPRFDLGDDTERPSLLFSR